MNRLSHRYLALRLVLFQALFAALFALLMLLVGLQQALSAFMGGIVSVIPNLYFALRVFRKQGAQQAKNILSDFFAAEAIKILLVFVLFGLVFKYFSQHIQAFYLFIGFILNYFIIWLAPIIMKTGKQ